MAEVRVARDWGDLGRQVEAPAPSRGPLPPAVFELSEEAYGRRCQNYVQDEKNRAKKGRALRK